MKKIKLILFFVLICKISFSQIRITSPEYNFGDIFEQKGLVYAQFKLENPYSTDTIIIQSIDVSCGCTAIITKDTILYPKSTLNFKVSYNPEGRAGLFNKSIKLQTLTGTSETNYLYLKVIGNVIPKVKAVKTNVQLIEYKVAPIYFYPITVYDTSYLDFNYIKDFVNNVTYEIDYYQFATVGFKIKVRNKKQIEALEYLIRFIKHKLLREMDKRNYGKNRLFFARPFFEIDANNSIPKQSVALIKVFSTQFNNDNLTKSYVKLTNTSYQSNDVFLLKEKASQLFNIDSVKNKIDFNNLTKLLLHDSILKLNINLKTPESYSRKKAIKFKKSFNKMIYKELKNEMGIKKHELILNYDSTFSHASTNFILNMWQTDDLEKKINIKHQIQQDYIISPLLPTFKSKQNGEDFFIDTTSVAFKQFWNSLLSYPKVGKYVTLILESSTSYYPKSIQSDPKYIARKRAKLYKNFIEDKFYIDTHDSIKIIVKNVVQGPTYYQSKLKHASITDFAQYEYLKLIPCYNNQRKIKLKTQTIKPYMINYDYYFIGIDTTSFIFKKFASYLIYEIQKTGFVELKTESSVSYIPIEKRVANKYLAYKHLNESKKRLNAYLASKLIDPNRVIINEERIIEQGIPYDKKTPIVRYKKYQYVRFIPNKFIIYNKL